MSTVLFARWEAFWLCLRGFWERMTLEAYHPHYPDDNERLEHELAQCISFLFWPPMHVSE